MEDKAVAWAFIVVLLGSACSAESTGSSNSANGGSTSNSGTGGVVASGGIAPSSGGAAGSRHDAGAGGADERPDGAAPVSMPAPGECVSKKDLPASCDEVCLDQGKRCSEDCDFGTALLARAAYYPDLESCQSGEGLTFAETAKCSSEFDPGDFLPYAAVRCCCQSVDFDVATATEKMPLCRAACAKDPYTPVAECMSRPCTELCLDSTRGFDLECATCLTKSVGFLPSECGSRECVCGGPSFPDPAACKTECAASLQHERDVLAARPRPEPLGRSPAAQFNAPAQFQLKDLLVDETGHVWVTGSTSSPDTGNPALSVALFDADLNLIWKWEDPAKRSFYVSEITRLGTETVVTADITPGLAPLLFFDASGFEREVTTTVNSATALSAFRDGLLLRDFYSPLPLTALDVTGALRFSAPVAIVDGLSGLWEYTVDGDSSWTLVDYLDNGVQWRRVAVSSAATGNAVSVAWTHKLSFTASVLGIDVNGAGPASAGRVLAWGARIEQRGPVNGGFPWIAELADDGTAAWQWSNGDHVTPGPVNDAVRTASGLTCTTGKESWELLTPATLSNGVLCSPDGCDSLTVRCLDRTGAELWNYHHRNETSEGRFIAANASGQIFVTASIVRGPKAPAGTGDALMRFDP